MTLGFAKNQTARRKLAAKLLALTEHYPAVTYLRPGTRSFDDVLLAINAHLESLSADLIEQYWDKWTDIHDALLIETDDQQRLQLEFMLALVGTAINEMRNAKV